MDEELIRGMKTLKPKAKQENDEMRIAGGKTAFHRDHGSDETLTLNY